MDKRTCSSNDRCLTVLVNQSRPKFGSFNVAEVRLKIKEGQMLQCVKDKQGAQFILKPKRRLTTKDIKLTTSTKA